VDFRRDTLGHDIRIAERLAIANPHDTVALLGEPGVSLGVTQLGFWVIVPTAIDFNDEARAVVNEVSDIAADRRLPADM
jgi:hypothetical protein